MNNTTETTQTEETKTIHNNGVFAVISYSDDEDVVTQTIKTTTRSELLKALATYEGVANFRIIGVFKGKQLKVSEKKSLRLN